jgi:hypothetical protein
MVKLRYFIPFYGLHSFILSDDDVCGYEVLFGLFLLLYNAFILAGVVVSFLHK